MIHNLIHSVFNELMMIILFLVVVEIVNSQYIDYCGHNKNHPLCGVTCLHFPNLCSKKRKDILKYDESHNQRKITNREIQTLTISLNNLRADLMQHRLSYSFSYTRKKFTLRRPVMLYEVVRNRIILCLKPKRF